MAKIVRATMKRVEIQDSDLFGKVVVAKQDLELGSLGF